MPPTHRYIRLLPPEAIRQARQLLQELPAMVHHTPGDTYLRVTGLGYNTPEAEQVKQIMQDNGFLLCGSKPCPHLDVRVKNKPLVTPETGEPLVLDYHLTSRKEKEIECQQFRERV